jgi:hypothetical protein
MNQYAGLMGMDPTAFGNNITGNTQDPSSMGMNMFNGIYPGMMYPPQQNQGGQYPNVKLMNQGEKNNNDIINDNDINQ